MPSDEVLTNEPYPFVKPLVRLWREYKAECWADSVIVADSMFIKTAGLREKDWDKEAWRGFLSDKKTIHHKPTAEGFLDWLERRIKR